MQKNWKTGCLVLILVLLSQLACVVTDLAPEPIQLISPSLYCMLTGGKWYDDPLGSGGGCIYPEKPVPQTEADPDGQSTQVEGGPEGQPPVPQVQPIATEGGGGATPVPASVQECNATGYIHTLIEIVKNVQEQYYRECHYKLTLFNVHSEGIWIVRNTNVNVHSVTTDSDSSYWYSDLVFPGQSWEYVFRSSYFSDGQTSREGVDRIAGVYNRPDCIYLLTSDEIEFISTPIEWACGP